ncbi:hypothetical protein C8R47DRAFT_673068 [Mycena vitilis]|nr:hypothetical protein C8R47DRAFT_673068 [Mycena vitilis]
MPSTNIHFVNTFLEALMRLVRYLFGSSRVEDAEEGKGAPMELKSVGKASIVAQGDVPTFKPDLAGVPALAMSCGAAFMVAIPTIVITPPDDENRKPKKTRAREPSRRPLQQTAATPTKRVHGKTPPRKRPQAEKENVADHPNAPRRPQVQAARRSLYGVQDTSGNSPAARTSVSTPTPSVLTTPVDFKAVEAANSRTQPGTSAWERAKLTQLEEARAWSVHVKARHHRRSLPAVPAASWVPAPLVRRASLSSCVPLSDASPSPQVRLPLAERLKRAVVVCTPPAPEPVPAPVARLWSDDKGIFAPGFKDEEEEKDERPTSNVVKVALWFQNTDTSLASLSSSDSLSSLSSSGSFTGILDQFEDDLLHSPAWLGRRRFPQVEGPEDDGTTTGCAHRDSTWSEVFSLDAYA